MPTGYTSKIYQGQEQSPEEYILSCARAFGALVMMRDDPMDTPIPEKFEPDDYSKNQLVRASEEFEKLKQMTLDEAQVELDASYAQTLEKNTKIITEKQELAARYNAMLEKVRAWQSPSDEHVQLKEFCIEQLESSIEHDCDTSYYEKQLEKETAAEWLKQRLESAEWYVKYHTENLQNAIESAENRTRWVQQLKDSLK